MRLIGLEADALVEVAHGQLRLTEVEVGDAPEMIGMEESPVGAFRKKSAASV